MATSKNTTPKKTAKKTNEQKAEPVAVAQQPAKRKSLASVRRVPVQYTPHIPTARCPRC